MGPLGGAGGGGRSGRGLVPRRGGLVPRRGGLVEEAVPAEAGVAHAAVRVEDPELRPPPRRAEPVAGHGDLRPLADDVPTEPDPRPAGELEAETGRFRDGGGQAGGQAGRLEGDEERLRAAGERGQPAQAVGEAGHARAGIRARWQVDDEEVDGPAGQQRPGDRQALVERRRGQDHQPVEADPAGGGLDRVEGPGNVQPGDDRSAGLGLCRQPEGQRRLAGRGVPPQPHARAARQAAGTENRIEGREAGPDDPLGGDGGRGGGGGKRWSLTREGGRGERPDDPRSCRAPACLEGRHGSRYVGGERRHAGQYRTDVLLVKWARRGRERPPGGGIRAGRRRGGRSRFRPGRATGSTAAARPRRRRRRRLRPPARTSWRARRSRSGRPRGRSRRR